MIYYKENFSNNTTVKDNKYMYNRTMFIFVGLIFTCINIFTTAYALEAKLDRQIIGVGESVGLKLISDKAFKLPDLSALEEFFAIDNTSTQHSQQIINGKITTNYTIHISLIAIKAGNFTIPAFTIQGHGSTQAIDIQIKQTAATQIDQDISIITTTDSQNYYVQQQILLTTKLFISEYAYSRLSNAQLDNLTLDKAAIIALNDSNYSKTIAGTTYRVVEQQHAIFPQQSGKLVIPSRKFNAYLGFRRKVTEVSDAIELDIQPAAYTDKQWLPAHNLVINTTELPQSITTDDSIKYTIEISAYGLQESQLPNIKLDKIANASLYPDKLEANNYKQNNNIIGKKQQSWVIVPNSTGVINIPEFTLTWFNTTTSKIETAFVPARSIKVTASTTTQAPLNNNPLYNYTSNNIESAPQRGSIIASAIYPLWIYIVIGLLTFLWLITLAILIFYLTKNTNKQPKITVKTANNKLKTARQKLLDSIAKTDLPQIISNFITWCSLHATADKRHSIITLNQAYTLLLATYTHASTQPIIEILSNIDKALYSQKDNNFVLNSKQLKDAIGKLKQQTTSGNSEINLYN